MKKKMFYALSALLLCSACTTTPRNPFEEPARPAGQESVLKLACEPLDTVRVGFIGLGARGRGAIERYVYLPDAKVVALCDLDSVNVNKANEILTSHKLPAADIYVGEDVWKEMCGRDDIDLVYICTDWHSHAPMAVYAMKQGKHVAVEVPAAMTVAECWDLVNVSEATGSHLNIMENVCYRRDCMAALNMVRQGLFGEILHGGCGYEHDLREVKFNDGTHYNYVPGSGDLRMGPTAFAEAQWRTNHSVHRNGDIYPTHGIGPIAHCMDINRGNRFLSLSAMATQSRGLHKFIVDNGGENHPLAKVNFNLGDIVTSMIKCSNGQTIIVTHDTNSPRPYSLGFRVQGTEGLWMNDGDHVYVQGKSKPHRWDDSDEWFKKYDHKLWASLESQAAEAGHGGMDYIMMYDLIDAIRNKKPAPMDCYDAAAWSAISGLSEMSIARGGALVDFPDFTRGQWIHRQPQFAL